MTYESNSTAHQHKRHRLWPLAAALWAAVGLSPCALAAVGDLDCLHCPVEDGAAGHAGHGGADMHGEHQGHGDGHAAAASDCGDDCRDSGDSLVDARGVKTTSKDVGETAAIPLALRDAVDLHVACETTGLDPPRQHPIPRQRLHARICVYLD